MLKLRTSRRRYFHQYRPVAITAQEATRISAPGPLVKLTFRMVVATIVLATLGYLFASSTWAANEVFWPLWNLIA